MTDNIFNIGDEFEGMRIVRKLSSHHDGHREVYLVENKEDKKLVLTLFDIASEYYDLTPEGNEENPDDVSHMPEIPEIAFLKSAGNAPGLCPVEETGDSVYGDRHYKWMTQTYLEGETLESKLRSGHRHSREEIGRLASLLCEVSECTARLTDGGGHYNISPENILVRYEDDTLREATLIGFTHVGGSVGGGGRKGYEEIDWRNRAPETYKGMFDARADIFGIGMVLLEMANVSASGEKAYFLSPVESPDTGDQEAWKKASSGFRAHLWASTEKKLSLSMRTILRKATDGSPLTRFPNVRRFRKFIVDFVTKDTLPGGATGQAVAEGEALPEIPVARNNVNKAITATETATVADTGRIKSVSDPHALDKVAGMEDLKNFFRRDFISIVRNPQIAARYGIKPSNCTLLYGPQGCGKTFIAEKAAQESGLKYRIVSPSELGSIYVHGAQQKIAEAFAEAEKKGPMILIFDEFDALVPSRNSESNPNQANEVNEMLIQLNNCADRGIYVIACTNRPCDLDPAIMRKGRVDRTVYVPMPDLEVRKELFRLELSQRPCAPDIDLESLGKVTDHYTCSDITYIVDEASRQCFEETVRNGLEVPVPLTMKRLEDVASTVVPSVTELQRRDFLALRDRMENRRGRDSRKSIGFIND